MKIQDTVRQFGNYTKVQAKALKDGLGLKMSMETLAFCMKYYRDGAGRDPFADELLMLDHLTQALEEEIDSVAPVDLYTNDDFAAETYADILSKRRAHDPHAPHPCTLREALQMASIHLFSAGRDAIPYRGASLIPEYLKDYPLAPNEDCISAPNAPYRLRILPTMGEKEHAGDLLVLLTPTHGQTQLQFQRCCEGVLSDATLLPSIHAVTNVHPAGLLRTLLGISNSLSIVLTPFSALETPLPLTVLTDQYGGCRILRIAATARETLLPAVRHMGITASVFAEVTNDGMYTFRRGNAAPFSVDPQFLRSLFHYKGIKVTLPPENALSPIAHRAVTPLNCRYLSTKNADCSDVTLKNGILATAASSILADAPMRSALYTTLLPILTLCAQGIPLREQSLSVGIELPQGSPDPKSSAATLAMALGLYRAQIELAVPAQANTVRSDPKAGAPTLTAFATAKGSRILPGCLTKPGSFVYCLSPAMREDDRPDFRSLREYMSRLVELAQKGEILSACVLGGESITDGLAKMKGNYSATLCDGKLAAESALPIAILIESESELPYTKVAVTVKTENTLSTPEAALPVKDSMIWSERPEIVILAKESDADARTLAFLLSARNCNVHLHSDSGDADRLSRSLLGANTLILCPGSKLPAHRRVRFALAVMRTAGSTLLSLDPQNRTEKEFIRLPNGLSAAVLEQIAPKNEKKLKKY